MPRRPGIPRYFQIPRWGLFDVVPDSVDDAGPADLHAPLRRWLTFLWPLLAAAAVTQLARYLTLVVNRSRPIPAWWDLGTLALALLCGWVAAAGILVALYYFASWMIRVRADSYARAGQRDPRRRVAVAALAGVVYVNVLGAPLLLLEAARAIGGPAADRAERAITKVATAWGLVTLIGTIALGYRIVAAFSDSVQTGAGAMVWTVLAFAASAVFVRWLGPRLNRVVAGDEVAAEPARRLMVAA